MEQEWCNEEISRLLDAGKQSKSSLLYPILHFGLRSHSQIGSVPSEENSEKALKYERSIQKSIFQNLFLLKKLQRVF